MNSAAPIPVRDANLSTRARKILSDIKGGSFITVGKKARATIKACAELQKVGLIDVHVRCDEYVIVEKGASVQTLFGTVGG